ncbi:NAD(P)/FAD-dependent oxidoreductase [Mucilaginibacter robiniae]|uniref:NAD(P)/FAD-dependent oxidoreductase n=1 Tax=Mucilaginibacter robiniae TaxID=2728022 RepID=A0A7L5E408_9SPHI|nr:NAD(P)/FAD-dependent oxidoreductase [Mucilaginibacter robiniae]QJD97137.1 NAD(P)/FAD-dependent oxidoreductase [Mucilaginibacter robiniae]
MENQTNFDAIIIGGSSAGLSAGMALGRALKKVLIIDSGLPCNRQTPHSHNFITHDGWKPSEIMEVAKNELLAYDTVMFSPGLVTEVTDNNGNFKVTVANQSIQYIAKKMLFATGVKDIMPNIPGFADCWGISVIHCPYCHGYEYRGKKTGILMNSELAADFAKFIRNWTPDLTLFTNGKAKLTPEQQEQTLKRNIQIVEKTISSLQHENGHLKSINFTDGTVHLLDALYGRQPFEQHCSIPEHLGCTMTEQGYIQVDEFKKTSVAGIYAAGDNTTPFRSVAAAVAAGNLAGAMINHEIINESE